MKGISSYGSHAQAANAYKKAVGSSVKSAAKSLQYPKPGQLQKENTAALLQPTQNVVNIASNTNLKAINIASFPELLKAMGQDYVRKLRKAEKKTTSAIEEGSSLVEVMSAVNESEITLQKVVAVRDRFIQAYQEILKMPL